MQGMVSEEITSGSGDDVVGCKDENERNVAILSHEVMPRTPILRSESALVGAFDLAVLIPKVEHAKIVSLTSWGRLSSFTT